MDYLQMTDPCGRDCFNCHFFLAHKDQEAMNQPDFPEPIASKLKCMNLL